MTCTGSAYRVFSTRAVLTSLVLAAALAGCKADEKKPAAVDCSGTQPDAICSTDADGDGLVYSAEVRGWEVWPDRFGLGLGVDTFGQMNAHYLTTSDPDVADSDGDGRNDFQEFLDKTDPTLADTDGDGLTDREEIERFRTNPLSVDTDADSRGPNGDLTPLSTLFDAAELKIDMLGDPTHRPGKHATSPILADTDGDRRTDWAETAQGLDDFNPTLADLPKVTIHVSSSPIIRLIGTYESGASWSRDVSMTDTLSQSLTEEASVSHTTELALSGTAQFGVEVGFEAGTETKTVGKTTWGFSVTAGVTNSDAVSWGQSNTRAAESAYQETSGEGGSTALTLTGGYVSVNVDITNTGRIAYSLDDLSVNVLARFVDGTSAYSTVLELRRADNTPTVLAPGETRSNVLLTYETADYELVRSFLRNPSGVLLEVGSYDLTDGSGQSFAFSAETIRQRTALVVVDYGGLAAPGRYLVATSPSRDADGRDGLLVTTALSDVLGIEHATTEKVPAAGDPYHVLSSVTPPGAAEAVANSAAANKKWLILLSTDLPSEVKDFDALRLLAGDAVYLMYVGDADEDGLSDREEALSGTSDGSVDTDGDGLGDFAELRTGWTVRVAGQAPYTALSRGYITDSDADGIDDPTEATCGLDPVRTDTDQDGIGDYEELHGYDVLDASDAVKVRMVPYAGQVILDGGNAVVETAPAGDDVLLPTGAIDKGAALIGPGPNGTLETTPSGDDYAGAVHSSLPWACYFGAFATDPLSADTDGDTVPDGTERRLALGSANYAGDFAFYVDSDGDGLSDAVEQLGFRTLVNGAWKQVTSDPTKPDTDLDGLPDLLEYLLGSDPRSLDTDGDLLSDLDEYDFETGWAEFEAKCSAAPSCVVTVQGAKHGTSLTNADTDGDGLSDGAEIAGWWVRVTGTPAVHVTSDPKRAYSDTDTWNDYWEAGMGTNPNVEDTDGDLMSDDEEFYTCCQRRTYECRDPLTKDALVRLTLSRINTKSSSEVWYWYQFSLLAGVYDQYVFLQSCDACAGGCGSGCTHVTGTGEVSLGNTSIDFVMKKDGDSMTFSGSVHQISSAADPRCWFAGFRDCSTASWSISKTFSSGEIWAMARGVNNKVYSGGGQAPLDDDELVYSLYIQ